MTTSKNKDEKMPQEPLGEERWFENLRQYYWLSNVIRTYTGMPYWIVRRLKVGSFKWYELNEKVPSLMPYHFEMVMGTEKKRDIYFKHSFEKACKDQRLTVVSHHGFCDLFYPLSQDSTQSTVIYAGQFLSALPDAQNLARSWESTSGRKAASGDPDYLAFAHMALSLPVIEKEVLAALEKFLEMFSAYLTGQRRSKNLRVRIDKLIHDVFSRYMPDTRWIDQAIGFEPYLPTPWYGFREMLPWMIKERGLNRIPTRIVAVMPLPDAGREEDAVASLLRVRRIQRTVFDFVRESMPQTTAAPIQDYGVALLTSTAPGVSASAARVELKERAESVRAFIRETFSLRCVAGVGRAVPPADPLLPSWDDALLAMHASVQLDRTVLFYGQKDLPPRRYGYAQLRAAAAKLVEALSGGDAAAAKPAADQYVRVLLVYSNQRMEAVRGQFLALMFEALEGLHKRFLFSQEDLEQASQRLSAALENAVSLYQLIESFKDTLNRLLELSGRARGGPKHLRLESTLQFLRENYRNALRLPQVARMAGFSVAAFSRTFKEATGTSFAVYVRQIRVAEAKRLLRASSSSVIEISQRTGFQSSHRLIRAFKLQVGQTPGQYREGKRAR